MHPVAEFLVWCTLGGLFYIYLGYPLLLAILAARYRKPVARRYITPKVTIVIAAWNEGIRLPARIENCLSQHYPPGRLDVIVVSDGATDNTEQVVQQFVHRRVKLIKLETRQGKAAALNAGVAASASEVIVFADARQEFALSVVAELVANFSDPQVGAVSGELMLRAQPDGTGVEAAGIYWNLEKWIRRSESTIDSVIGTTGAIYAIRRSLFEPMPPGTILDDLLVPMRIAMRGSRVIFEPRARAFDWIERDYAVEFKRKVRTLAGNYQALVLCPDLLKPWKNRLFVQFVSHKVCRLAAPFLLIALFLSNLLVMDGWLGYLFALQVLGYSTALLGWWLSRLGIRERWTAAAYTFFLLQYAALIGAIKFLRRDAALWDNSRGTSGRAPDQEVLAASCGQPHGPGYGGAKSKIRGVAP